MKDVKFTVTDAEHSRLSNAKGERTWREAVFEALGVERDE